MISRKHLLEGIDNRDKTIKQLQAKVKRLEKEVARLENAKLKISKIILGDEILRIEHAGETPNGLQVLVTKP